MYYKISDLKHKDEQDIPFIVNAVQELFPIEGNIYTLDIKNVKANILDSSNNDISDAIKKGKSITNEIKADVELIDNKTKKVIDKRKNMVIMKPPKFTSKNTYIIEGNSYVVPNQQRLKPGAYLVKRKSGEPAIIVNTKENRQFKFMFNPETGIFFFFIGNTKIPFYYIYKTLGGSDNELEKILGKKLLEVNKKAGKEKDVESFVEKSHKTNIEDLNNNEKLMHIANNMTFDKNVIKRTLGIEEEHMTPRFILSNIKMMLAANKGEELDYTSKNNLANRYILTSGQLFKEFFLKQVRKEIFKIRSKLNNPQNKKISDIFSHSSLSKPAKAFFTTSKISRMPEEYNPMQTAMASHLLTPMGEGGIETDRALTEDDKSIHDSHLGFIDPIVSPEGANAGITLGLTDKAYTDENGNPAIEVINAKTNKKEIVPVEKLWDKKLAYPTPKERQKEGVPIRIKDQLVLGKSVKDADYYFDNTADMHTLSAKYLSLIGNMDSNRATMAQKHTQQALSLKDREAPYVDSGKNKQSLSHELAEKSNQIIKSPVAGTVTKVTDKTIYIGTHKIDLGDDIPLSRKSYISYKPTVKVGDKVKIGQVIAESNFAKNGELALGVHLRTAFLSMPGNRNDAFIISESAAKKMTSLHMYREIIHISPEEILDLKKADTLFPMTLRKFNLANYDEHGIIKKGTIVKPHEPLVITLKPNEEKPIEKLERTLFKPFKIKLSLWEHSSEGEIVSVDKKTGEIRIFIKTESPMQLGDKLSGRFGNKGTVGEIRPDDQMPKNEKGEPVDVVATSAGVVSRTNPGQVIEGLLGKVTEKTGKKYNLDLYSKEDMLDFAEKEAAKYGIKDNGYEKLINPETGKPFPEKIFVGNSYTYKLFKDSESGLSAQSTDKIDVNKQPGKGGHNSASSFSNMEINGLLSHGATHMLREARVIKGQANEDWFNAYRNGEPLPRPAENFAFEKFKAMLNQLGISVVDNKKEFNMLPMTNKEILEKGPKEVKMPDTINANNGKEKEGGLFDPKIFGELGNRYAHIKLAIPIVNPLYTKEIAGVLGVTENTIKDMLKEDPVKLSKEISSINIDSKIKELKKDIKQTTNISEKDKKLRILRFLLKAEHNKQKLSDIAIIKNIPVIPPAYRPIIKDHTGKYGVVDLNLHYQDIININNTIKELKNIGLSKDTENKLHSTLFNAVGAMYGLNESDNKNIRSKKVKGVLKILSGDNPKTSYIHKALLRKNQFMSGRSVITPSKGDIPLDGIEIPVGMGLKMYEPHISREMSKMGYSPIQTKELIEKKDPRVINVLNRIGKDIPIIYNRAPTLWKHNLVGAYPIFTEGHNIVIPPMVERALNADYDGDQIGVHVPITPEAIKDVKEKMLASKQLFTDQGNLVNKDLLMMVDQDAILGVHKASVASKKPIIKVKNNAELKELIAKGAINYNDRVIVLS